MVSALVEVKEGAGAWVDTVDGVNVAPSSVISIRLKTPGPVTTWKLQCFGTDEVTSTAPTLTNVSLVDSQVTTPSTVVTFTMPAGAGIGRALVFRSIADGGGAGLTVTFGVYVLTTDSKRVGAVGETREGSAAHGWAAKVNPVIRTPGGGGGGTAAAVTYSDTVAPTLSAANVQAALDIIKPRLPPRVDTANARDYVRALVDANFAFQFPTDIAYDGTSLWVLDGSSNNPGVTPLRLHRFTPSGTTLLHVASINLPVANESATRVLYDTNHVYVGTYTQNGPPATGTVHIIAKSTNTIVGLINAAHNAPNGVPWAFTSDNTSIYVASAPTGGGTAQIDKYTKAAVLAAYPSPGTSIATLNAAPGELFNGDLLLVGGFLFATDNKTPGTLWKIDLAGSMSIDSSYTHPTTGLSRAVYFAGTGRIWVCYGGPAIYEFNPANIAAGPTFTLPTFGASDTPWYPTSDGTYLWIGSNGGAGRLLRVNPTTKAIVAVVTPDPTDAAMAMAASAFDGTHIWSCSPTQNALIETSTGLGTEARIRTFEGVLTLAYDAGATPLLPSLITSPPNAGDTVRVAASLEAFNAPQGLHFDGVDLWVAGQNAILTRIDPSTIPNTLVASLSLTPSLHAWSVTSDATHAFVSTRDAALLGADGRLLIVSKVSNTIVGIGDAGIGTREVEGVAVNGDNIYVTSANTLGLLEVQRFSKAAVLAAFPAAALPVTTAAVVDGFSDYVDLDFGGGFLFLTNGSAGVVYKIDPITLASVDSFNAGFQQGGCHYAFGSVWTTGYGSAVVSRYNPANLAAGPTATLPFTGSFTNRISSDATTLWIDGTTTSLPKMWRISTGAGTEAIVGTFPVPTGATPQGLAFDGSLYLYVADPAVPFSNTVHKIDTSTLTGTYAGTVALGSLTVTYGRADVSFDDPLLKINLYSNRTQQSKAGPGNRGIVNLSTDTSGVSIGANANFATILGGDLNVVEGEYGVIVGGIGNKIGTLVDGGVTPRRAGILGGETNSILGASKWASIVGGENNFITTSESSVISGGTNSSITGGSHVHIFGTACSTSDVSFSHIGSGSGNQIIGPCTYSNVSGQNSIINVATYATIGGGVSNTVSADGGTIPGGQGNAVSGAGGLAHGLGAAATRTGQYAHAAGQAKNVVGDGQFGRMLRLGQSVGGAAAVLNAPGTSGYPVSDFNLVDGRAYAIRATVIANRTDAPGRAVFVDNILASCAAGVATINVQAPDATATMLNGEAWTISYTVGAENIIATFTGTVGHTVNAIVTYEWTELTNVS